MKHDGTDGHVWTAAPIDRLCEACRLIWRRAARTASRRWRFSLALLLLAYFVAGIFERFPWKADEPHSFGMLWEILEENQWLVMQIADQPFVEKPPLVYWLGALCAKPFPFLPAHESSRLVVPILVAITVFALHASARRLWPETVRWRAWVRVAGHDASDRRDDAVRHAPVYALLALAVVAGTFGFSEQIHKLTAELGQLAGAVVALYGLIRVGAAPERGGAATTNSALQAGLIVSIGVGIAFLSKGLLIPGVIALTWVLCLALPAYRTPAAMVAAMVAMVGLMPWLLIWPAALYRESPEVFAEWFWTNNVGRFLGFVALGGNRVSLTDTLRRWPWPRFLPCCSQDRWCCAVADCSRCAEIDANGPPGGTRPAISAWRFIFSPRWRFYAAQRRSGTTTCCPCFRRSFCSGCRRWRCLRTTSDGYSSTKSMAGSRSRPRSYCCYGSGS